MSFRGSAVHPSHVGASVGLVNRVGRHAMTRPHRGKGLSAEVRERLFEPFFTTRRDGTGLGLAVCYGLVTAHGGTIRAEARAGGGSQFVVDLPDVLIDEESE